MAILLSTISPPLSQDNIQRLKEHFDEVHSFPNNRDVPIEIINRADAYFCLKRGLPEGVSSFKDFKSLKLIQLSCAGANDLIDNPSFAELTNSNDLNIVVSNASGLHVTCVAPYAIACILNIYHRLPEQLLNQVNKQEWIDDLPDHHGNRYKVRSLRGKTVGILGYGHLGRECARLLKTFGCRIIAANTSGERTQDSGFIIPGTGDFDATIPEKMFSSKDGNSLREMISGSDILISSLPWTKQTTNILNADLLCLLNQDGVFVNIGRGNVIETSELMKALNEGSNTISAALDVTDPEPLPNGHKLWTHPRVLITPHLSGEAELEFELATDILIENIKKIKTSQEILNRVDLVKGY
ncbi:hypothetical protein E3Q20_04454 [Wallemia mellicola]|nr:hypothetical protein E3Q20_04454 [Wallemia mellicola]